MGQVRIQHNWPGQNWSSGPGQTSSVPITGISFDAASHNRFDNNTDIFPHTWADDGNLYVMGGDGDGWDGVDTRGLDVNQLTANGPDGDLSQGTEVNSKSSVLPNGIISIDGTMYRTEVERQDADGDGDTFEKVMIGKSTDRGSSWTYLTGGDPTVSSDYAYDNHEFRNLSFVKMGQDYSTWWSTKYGGEGEYVYGVSEGPSTGGGGRSRNDVILMRSSRGADLRDTSNHQYFAGATTDNTATWTTDLNNKQPIYQEGNSDLHFDPRMTWNPILNRFLLTHFDDADNGVLTVLEGPTPWGDWTQIYNSSFPSTLGDGTEKLSLQFVNKRGTTNTNWLSTDGETWWATFSGSSSWDSFNTVKATLTTT